MYVQIESTTRMIVLLLITSISIILYSTHITSETKPITKPITKYEVDNVKVKLVRKRLIYSLLILKLVLSFIMIFPIKNFESIHKFVNNNKVFFFVLIPGISLYVIFNTLPYSTHSVHLINSTFYITIISLYVIFNIGNINRIASEMYFGVNIHWLLLFILIANMIYSIKSHYQKLEI